MTNTSHLQSSVFGTVHKQISNYTMLGPVYNTSHFFAIKYCKTRFIRVPFISWISRAWQVRENNRPRKFGYSSVSV